MIQIKEEHETYFEIYSDRNKKIYEPKIDYFWNNYEDEPIAVNKERYANSDYQESEIDCDEKILENVAEIVDNNE